LRQQLESRPDIQLQPSLAAQPPRLPANESPCFIISRIALVGETADRFTDITEVANYAADGSRDAVTGSCIGSTGIGITIRRLQNELLRRGYVTTRVLAGPQDLTHGALTVTLIPGRVHAIRFAENTSTRATIANAIPMQTGDLLNLRAIEQALENLKRVPTTEADIRIEPANGGDVRLGTVTS